MDHPAGFEVRPCGLLPSGKPTLAEWEDCGRWLSNRHDESHWCVGDWLIIGDADYGDEAAKEAAERCGFAEQTCQKVKWVAGSIEFCRRRQNLSWSHHHEVAPLAPAAQDELLDAAKREGWTVRQLREVVKARKPRQEKPWSAFREAEVLYAYLCDRRDAWPEDCRHEFIPLLLALVERMRFDDAGREGAGAPPPGEGETPPRGTDSHEAVGGAA